MGEVLGGSSAVDAATVPPHRATWPYETLLLPKRHVLRLPDLSDEERTSRQQQAGSQLGTHCSDIHLSFPRFV